MVLARQGRWNGRPLKAGGMTMLLGATVLVGAAGTADAIQDDEPEISTAYVGHIEVLRKVGA